MFVSACRGEVSKAFCVFAQDSSSVMEWDQCSADRSHQLLETQQSYETEWDMVNAVSFKKKTCLNGEGELSASSVKSFLSAEKHTCTHVSNVFLCDLMVSHGGNENILPPDKHVSLHSQFTAAELFSKFCTDVVLFLLIIC